MRLKLIFIISTTITILDKTLSQDEDHCPDPNCHSLCLSSLTQNDCAKQNQFIVPNSSLCGCCPGCRGGVIHDNCNNDTLKCAPGLKCVGLICHLDKLTCAYTYHLKNFRQLPICEVDGNFAAVQCKGDKATGRCFCYSETGERIYGWAWWQDSTDMSCACSRMKHKLNLEGHNDNTLHCDQKSNFEPLQCNDGVCWCADKRTGEPMKETRAVPSTMWKLLPCYDIDKMGQQYLRQCESAANAQHLIKKSLAAHGTTNVEFNNIQCDYDGNYGSYVINNNMAHCQWKDGSRITPYATMANTISKMNCYCARDQKIFKEYQLQHILNCNGNGNYDSLQNINEKLFCVDRDGFPVTDTFESEENEQPSCNQYLYYEATLPSKQ